MVDVAVSAGTILALGAAGGGTTFDPIALGLEDHYLFFHGLEAITYRRAGTLTWSKGIALELGAIAIPVAHVLRRQIGRREILASGGRFLAGDVVFEIPRALFALTPRPGDTIDAGGATWNVIAGDEATLRTRWRVFARHG